MRLSYLQSSHVRSGAVLLIMCAAVVATYWPPMVGDVPRGVKVVLGGSDFQNLHSRRLRYAQDALFGPLHALPGWYPPELGGTPFWSNLQNFPLIPTRLPLLLIDPDRALLPGIQMSALLAAIFMFLYLRRAGIGAIGGAIGGWTFACSGFFASRILAGHLPLLEAYPSLPLLLWLIEVNRPSPADDSRRPLKLVALALAACAVALAGHPQIPIYSFMVAGLYIIYRARNRTGARLAAAMVLGIGLAGFALYPMALLIDRSTRTLALDRAINDIAFPYGRFGAFLFPWRDGWPARVRAPLPPNFTGYPDTFYFWDTVCYVGWLPIVACVFLAGRAIVRKSLPKTPWLFIAIVGAAALLLALPWWQRMMSHIPGTILRSPARQIYVTTFALAAAAGVAVDCALCRAQTGARWLTAVVALVIAAHLLDLGWRHDRAFMFPIFLTPDSDAKEARFIAQAIGDGRLAMDYKLLKSYNRQFDDAGFFDSVILAKPYRALLDAGGGASNLNIQNVDGGEILPRALQLFGARLILTSHRPIVPLMKLAQSDAFSIYQVNGALPRVSVVPRGSAQFLSEQEIHDRLKDQKFDLADHLLLPADAPRPPAEAATTPSSLSSSSSLAYQRGSPDEFIASVTAAQPGYLRVLETWDPGWRASVDGAAAPVICAYDAFMAIPLSRGIHEIRLTFRTPGVTTGRLLSGLSLLALGGLCWLEWRGRAGKTARSEIEG